MHTMSGRQRRNFERGASVVEQHDRILSDVCAHYIVGSSVADRPPENPMICIVDENLASHFQDLPESIVIRVPSDRDGYSQLYPDILDRIQEKIFKRNPSLVFSCLRLPDDVHYNDVYRYYLIMEDASTSHDVLIVDTQYNKRWGPHGSSRIEIDTVHTIGNLSYATNNIEIQSLVQDWSFNSLAPRSLEEVMDEPFLDVLRAAHAVADLSQSVKSAFVTEYQQEMQEEVARP